MQPLVRVRIADSSSLMHARHYGFSAETVPSQQVRLVTLAAAGVSSIHGSPTSCLPMSRHARRSTTEHGASKELPSESGPRQTVRGAVPLDSQKAAGAFLRSGVQIAPGRRDAGMSERGLH